MPLINLGMLGGISRSGSFAANYNRYQNSIRVHNTLQKLVTLPLCKNRFSNFSADLLLPYNILQRT